MWKLWKICTKVQIGKRGGIVGIVGSKKSEIKLGEDGKERLFFNEYYCKIITIYLIDEEKKKRGYCRILLMLSIYITCV